MQLRTSLLLLVLATAIPMMAFAVLATVTLVQHDEENFVTAVKGRNRAFMSAVDGELKGTVVTLQALAASRNLARNNLRAFHEEAAAVLASQPVWVTLVLNDPDGLQRVNAFVPWGTALPALPNETDSFTRLVATREPVIGGVTLRGPFQAVPGIPVRVPVMRGGEMRYVLTAVLKPQIFQALMANQNLPEGWASGLVDASGRLIARVPARPIGTMASPDFLAHSRTDKEGWYRGLTLDGDDTFTAHVTSEYSGWSIGYAIPASLVFAAPRRSGLLMGGGALASLAVALLIAVWLGRRITEPMSSLAAAAPLLGSGAAAAPVDTRIREVAALAAAFGQADDAIRERDRVLRQSEADLRLADTNKSQFLAVLSHELRNPMAPLRNALTLLQMSPDRATIDEMRPIMERQINQLSRLIDDLLDVSRIDRGKLDIRRDRISLDAVLRDAIETSRPNLEAKSHELVLRYPADPVYVDGDPVRLTQVLSNLINNAAKFTPPRGHVEVTLRRDGADALVEVADNGIGVRAEDLPRIFDMFVQLDASRTIAAGGLGLGLTLARSIAEMHGGRLEARSDGEGRGSTFALRLPAMDAARAAARPGATKEPSGPTGNRVLIVDDNADAAETLAAILAREGYDVRTAFDGTEGLRLMREFGPEVAFIDLNMPGMSGYELARSVRGQQGAAVRLVALTGMGQRSDLQRTREAGFIAHLTKPASAEDLLRLAAGHEAQVRSLRP